MSAKTRLKGDYGKITTMTLGTEVSASTTLTEDTWYLVTAIDSSSSGFPSGATVGYLILSDGTETLAGDDKAKAVTFTDKCDIQSWKLDFSKDDIDVTTLCDNSKTYLPGDTDITGSATGVYKIGTTDEVGGIQNAFVDIVQASGTYAVNTINDDQIYLKLVTQEDTDNGETEQFYIMPVTFNTFNQGATRGEAQTFEAGFRLAPDDVNGVKFAYYSYTH